MSESFICRRGGVGTPFAVIGVTYPEGSTCTCTDGTKTLTAKGTSGRAIFNIPYAGTWTVTCTNGDDTTSQAVSITAEGQNESVALSFDRFIYKDGDLCTALTGGWQGRGLSATESEGNESKPTVTNTSDSLKVVFNPDGTYEAGGIVEPKLDIDLTDVKTISLTYKTSGWEGTTVSFLQVIDRSSCQYFFTDYVSRLELNVSVDSYKTVSLNVANLSGSYDVIVASREIFYSTSSATVFIKAIELKMK